MKTPQTACGPYRNDGIVKLGGKSLKTEVTKNSTEFDKGLGGRPCILSDQAMLFPFAKPAVIPMWMKDMKFPIDMVWINTSHRVVALEINVSPKTYPDKFENKAPAQFVLEIKANESRKLGIGLGSPVNF